MRPSLLRRLAQTRSKRKRCDAAMGLAFGFEQGIEQVTLAFFTTLAPTGTLAFVIMACFLLFGKFDEQTSTRIQRLLIVPIAFGMIGFIFSASHLGKPSNALYVLRGFARSPLSDEVVASVVFFGLAWIYWYLCFSSRVPKALKCGVLGGACLAGIMQLLAISSAYSIETISTWNSAYVPANLILAGLQGAPLAAICVLSFANIDNRKSFVALLTIAALASVAAAICQTAQNADLSTIQSYYEFGAAANLVPWYGGAIAASALCSACSIIIDAISLAKSRKSLRIPSSLACLIMLAGIFFVRFAFYCMHLRAGL